MEKDALRQALTTLQADHNRPLAGINLMLYQRLAQRWLGPVGWLVSIWSRLLIFGSGMLNLLRFGNPLRQMVGLFSAVTQLKASSRSRGAGQSGQRLNTILLSYRSTILRNWPDIAGRLIAGHFDPAVRRMETVLPDLEPFGSEISDVWQTALDAALEKKARQLSGGFLQVMFNLPAIAIMAYAGGMTAWRFFDGLYLTTDFFVHAFATLGFVLFLCFFVLQALIRLVAGGRRMGALAWQQARQHLEASCVLSANPVNAQLEAVLELEEMLKTVPERTDPV